MAEIGSGVGFARGQTSLTCKTDEQRPFLKGNQEFGNSSQPKSLVETSKSKGPKQLGVEMSEKKTIRVIKKEERTRKQKPAPKEITPRQTAREMVQTVTNWVTELQQKRRVETANAIKLLVPKSPRPQEG